MSDGAATSICEDLTGGVTSVRWRFKINILKMKGVQDALDVVVAVMNCGIWVNISRNKRRGLEKIQKLRKMTRAIGDMTDYAK